MVLRPVTDIVDRRSDHTHVRQLCGTANNVHLDHKRQQEAGMPPCSACWHQATRQTPSLHFCHSSQYRSTAFVARTAPRHGSTFCQQTHNLLVARRSRSTLTITAAAKPQSEREGPEKTNFITKLFRPLRDFGLGKNSLWEGGVGLFVFTGIGQSVDVFRIC